MLATMVASQQEFPSRHRSFDLHKQGPENLGLDDRLCPGCKRSAVNEQGGLVVAFGQSFFHVDCFRCAKCNEQVTADTNLLLLSDGSPICANCSYSCNVCHLPILDEAIMTGDDSYHAHCFKCKVCKNRIDELVFAKTSQGIYCMKCHNERMIKIRKHTQKKAERERSGGGSSSTKSREREARQYHEIHSPGFNDRPSSSRSYTAPTPPINTEGMRPSSSRSGDGLNAGFTSALRSGTLPHDTYERKHSYSPPGKQSISTQSSSYHPISVTVAPPETDYPPSHLQNISAVTHLNAEPEQMDPQWKNGLTIPDSGSVDARRRSYDDGVRPLNVLFGQKSPNSTGSHEMESSVSLETPKCEALAVNTPRRNKRRSINPDLSITPYDIDPGITTSNSFSPHSESFDNQQESDRLPHSTNASSRTSSPRHEKYETPFTTTRPSSHSSSILSYQSLTSPLHNQINLSRSPSPLTGQDESQEQTVVMKPSAVPNIGSEPPSQIASPSLPKYVRPLPQPGISTRQQVRLSDSLSVEEQGSGSAHRLSTTSSLQLGPRSPTGSRAGSPAHRADVPHDIDSGTDTDGEFESPNEFSEKRSSIPPALPPKDNETYDQAQAQEPLNYVDDSPSSLTRSQSLSSESDNMSESSLVESTSHSTYIAPALPPIRISLNTQDFTDLFNSMGGLPSLKALDTLSKSQNTSAASSATILAGLTPPRLSSVNENSASVFTPLPPNGKLQTAPVNGHEAAQNMNADSFLELDSALATKNRLIQPDQRLLQKSRTSTTESSDSVNSTWITVTEPESIFTTLLQDPSDNIATRLHEVLQADHRRQELSFDRSFVEAILETLESHRTELSNMKAKFDGMKRTSRQYIDGLTVAQTEYDKELNARRGAEAEVTRLRVLLSGQVARITALSSDNRRQELRQQLSKELTDSLSGLEHDLSRLKAEREVALAEVETLTITKSSEVDQPGSNLSRSLTKRLEGIRTQYHRELIPLTQERESLAREITELKAVRDVFLEETTMLHARNEELAKLSAVYTQRVDNVDTLRSSDASRNSLDRARTMTASPQSTLIAPSLSSSTSGSSSNVTDENHGVRHMQVPKHDADHNITPSKKIRMWGSRVKEAVNPLSDNNKSGKAAHLEHNFQQVSVLRFTRCDHCGDKLWGSQLRCTICNTSIHVRCIAHVHLLCLQQTNNVRDEQATLPPSMFGRELIEQVHADSKGDDRLVPVIVEKCIDAVEVLALDYEGIYRKSGGSGQSKAITQLFERGNYNAFDLRDTDRFNDICSVTSVLKNYFRSLPVPLLTFDLHDQIMSAIKIKELPLKNQTLTDLIKQLPTEHYYTLRMLMLHLHNVRERSEKNLMTARNLGVVFGPTLMRSRDPGAEFSDMAGKALFVEWIVNNAPLVFTSSN